MSFTIRRDPITGIFEQTEIPDEEIKDQEPCSPPEPVAEKVVVRPLLIPPVKRKKT